jgi:acetyl esterase
MSAVDVLARLTPRMREVLALQERLQGPALAPDATVREQRCRYATERVYWNEGGPRMARTVDDTVAGPYGPVRTRRYHPVQQADGVALLYVHGGGFVVGSLDTHDRIMRALADATGAVVVGVDYALSPEAKLPQAVEECAAVARHVAEHADELGVAGGRVAFAGDSGGANLALATTLWLRDHGGPAVESLLLYYGLFGLRDSVSRRLFGGAWDGLTPEDLDGYLAAYTSSPQDLRSPCLDCLSADLSQGIPPTYLVASALDPLLDDSRALAALLAAHGVEHRLHVVDGVLHGFLHHSRMLPEARQVLAEGAAFHRRVTAALV